MKYFSIIVIIIISCLIVAVRQDKISETSSENNNEDDSEILEKFQASHEWKKVKKGQPIPQGLHVRMNLQTGETEAKLLSELDDKRTDVLTVENTKEGPNSEEDAMDNNHNSQQIKESLLNLESDFVEPASEEDLKNIKEKFRSYKELKETFNELKMAVKTDMELMNDLLVRFKSKQASGEAENSDEEKLTILIDMEYLVHQFDTAREFVRLGGLTDVVLPILNGSRSALRSQAAHLLGSATQSNPQVQIAALDSGSMGSLLRALALDTDPEVRARALFALSCLVRNFPAAQARLVKEGGLSVLGQLFEREGQEELKLQVKAVTLLHDLMMERQDARRMLLDSTHVNRTELQEKLRQYKTVGLETKLVEQGWCWHLARLLLVQDLGRGRSDRRDDLSSAINRDLPVRPGHDVVEKVAGAMLAVAELCRRDFTEHKELQERLVALKVWYSDLATREDMDRRSRNSESDSEEEKQYHYYYSGMAQLFNNLTETLDFRTRKDEL